MHYISWKADFHLHILLFSSNAWKYFWEENGLYRQRVLEPVSIKKICM